MRTDRTQARCTTCIACGGTWQTDQTENKPSKTGRNTYETDQKGTDMGNSDPQGGSNAAQGGSNAAQGGSNAAQGGSNAAQGGSSGVGSPMNQSTEDSGEVVQTEALDDEIQVIASIYKFSSLGDRDRAVMCMNALARRHSIASQPSVERKTFSAERIAAASMETERLTRELDITNADHIVLWLDENKDNSPLGWLACRIIEAHEAHLNTLLGNPPKHKFWGAGEPDCPRGIRVGNGELHTLRCKVCADAIERGEHLTALATPDKDTPQ